MTVKSGIGIPENASSGNTASPRFAVHSPIRLTTLIFSRDRALQLDATLRTLRRHCRDLSLSTLKILYRASDARHAAQYRELKSCYREYTFIAENNFRADLLRALEDATGYLLFLVDDNIFTGDFSLATIAAALEKHPTALAFSLRLGRNTRHCYMVDRPQELPEFTEPEKGILKFFWTRAAGDFGFPLELSSSLYHLADLLPLLRRLAYHDPNTLEMALSQHKHLFAQLAPELLCCETSVTFCNPVNIVNRSCRCRVGNNPDYSSSNLAELFAQGFRIDPAAYDGFVSRGCHQEVELILRNPPQPESAAHASAPLATLKSPRWGTFLGILELQRELRERGLPDAAAALLRHHAEEHPAELELVRAVNWWRANRNDDTALPTSVAVIIPAHNCRESIVRSLESVTEACHFCRMVDKRITCEIVVIDDYSEDGTGAVVTGFAATCPYPLQLHRNTTNLGAGPSRNLGVRRAGGELLLFLDADDIFFPEHIFLCLYHLTRQPELHFVQTGIRIDEEIHHHWREAIANSVPFNICVRRWCHELLGGFPGGRIFIDLRCEDAVYRSLLSRYFLGGKLERETMQYFRYPGNALDRQMEKFSQPPGTIPQEKCMTIAELEALPQVQQFVARKREELEARLQPWLAWLGRHLLEPNANR